MSKKGNKQRAKTITTVNQFAVLVTKREGKKQQVNIAQTLEIIKIVRTLINRVGIDIYKVIGTTPIERFK